MSVTILDDPPVSKKSKTPPPVIVSTDEDAKVQLSFRAAKSLKARILACAKVIGVDDESTLIRMIITKFLPVYEEQAKQMVAAKVPTD